MWFRFRAPGVARDIGWNGREEGLVRWWKPELSRSVCGDAIILLFFAAQTLDGMLTYIGVSTMGMRIEANPLLHPLVVLCGLGTAVTAAKLVVAVLGIVLHRVGVHTVLATLTAVYVVAALVPWTGLFLMQYWLA